MVKREDGDFLRGVFVRILFMCFALFLVMPLVCATQYIADLDIVMDSAVIQSDPDTNYGSNAQLQVGFTGSVGDGSGSASYLYFPTSFIPEDATVLDAELRLYCAYNGLSAGGMMFDIHEVDDSWMEHTITFNNRPEFDLDDLIYSGHLAQSYCSGWMSFSGGDLITWVEDHRTSEGNGLALFSTSGNTYFNAWSKEHGSDLWPILRITYELDDGGDSCDNGIQDGDETGVDCGGSCVTLNEELCNGLDDNRNCEVDEGIEDIETGTFVGECQLGIERCIDGVFVEVQEEVGPEPDGCDGLDNDCDGVTDEDFFLLGAICTVGIGECQGIGEHICALDGESTECSVSEGEPLDEICDGLDNDCDGEIDNGIEDIETGTDEGVCQVGIQSCVGGSYAVIQEEIVPADEICDGLDHDCDGLVNEGGVCGICVSDDGCDDGNSYTEDTCVFAATPDSHCSYEVITCLRDLDCGLDGFIEELFCQDSEIFDNYMTYSCEDEGTVGSYCTNLPTPTFLEDCGGNYCGDWGENYCNGDNVYHSRTCYSQGCFLGSCYNDDSIEDEFVEDCEYRCGGGECLPPICEVNSPVVDEIYDVRKILFDIRASEELDKIEYIDYAEFRPRWKKLCRNCEGYDRARTIRNGEHELSIRCSDKYGNTEEYEVDFFSDSKNPRISKREPRRGSFTNGEDFMVRYTEDNVKLVSLLWNPQEERTDCPSGKNKKCYFDVDLDDYDGEEIEYLFIVEDVAGNRVESKPRRVHVDTTSPEISYFDYSIDGRRVEFTMDVTELNFDEINYIDWEDRWPKERKLCSRLKNGICEAKKTFRIGDHSLTITVLDKAGNSVQKNIWFDI